MYISLLDYLKEVRSKYYIVLGFIILFLATSFIYNLYKKNIIEFNARMNLINILSVSVDGSNPLSFNLASKWISNTAENIYEKMYKNEEVFIPLTCYSEDKQNITCNITGIVKDEEKVLKNILNSVNGSLDQYKIYTLNTIDRIIALNSEMVDYVQTNDEENVAEYVDNKKQLGNTLIFKDLLIEAIDSTKIKIESIEIDKFRENTNYVLIILSALICGLFAIFLQMKVKVN